MKNEDSDLLPTYSLRSRHHLATQNFSCHASLDSCFSVGKGVQVVPLLSILLSLSTQKSLSIISNTSVLPIVKSSASKSSYDIGAKLLTTWSSHYSMHSSAQLRYGTHLSTLQARSSDGNSRTLSVSSWDQNQGEDKERRGSKLHLESKGLIFKGPVMNPQCYNTFMPLSLAAVAQTIEEKRTPKHNSGFHRLLELTLRSTAFKSIAASILQPYAHYSVWNNAWNVVAADRSWCLPPPSFEIIVESSVLPYGLSRGLTLRRLLPCFDIERGHSRMQRAKGERERVLLIVLELNWFHLFPLVNSVLCGCTSKPERISALPDASGSSTSQQILPKSPSLSGICSIKQLGLWSEYSCH